MIYYAHSGVRYLVLLSGVIAVVMLTSSLRRPTDARARRAVSVFTGLLDLQVLLGLLNLMSVHFYPALSGHVVMMFAAAVVAHAFAIVNRNRPAEKQSNAFLLVGVALALALIVGGIMAIGRPILGSA